LNNFTGQGLINLYDGNGIHLRSITITNEQDQFIIPTADLKPGLYILVIEENGKQWDKIKIAVAR